MLDDLRKEAEGASFADEDEEAYSAETQPKKGLLTPAQRFVIVLMLFLVICLGGTFILLLTGKVVPPLA